MKSGESVLVFRVDADTWEHDDETGGLVHMVRSNDKVQIGLWQPGAVANTIIDVMLARDETLVVLAGSGRLQVDGGEPLELGVGTIVALLKGARTQWVVDDAFRELWVYS